MGTDNLEPGGHATRNLKSSKHKVILSDSEAALRKKSTMLGSGLGRRRLFAFSYGDIAAAAGVKVDTVRTAAAKGHFRANDLRSLADWIVSRSPRSPT